MTVDQLIAELMALPLDERMQVIDAVRAHDDSWVPESFRQGMKDFEEGRFVDMETALFQPYPQSLPSRTKSEGK